MRGDLSNPQGVGEHGSVPKGSIHQNPPKCSETTNKKVYGLPKNEESRCSKLDPLVKRQMSKNNKVQDTELSKIQALGLDAISPLAFHLEEASKEGNTSIPTQVVTEATRTALRLLGSATSHISTLRRRKILQDLNPDLQDLVEREDVFKSSAPLLFGEGFEVKAKAYTEGLRALSTASSSKRKVDFREHRLSYGQRRGGGHFRQNGRYQPYWNQAHKGGGAPTAAEKRKLHEEVRQIEDHYINNINSRHIIHNKVIFSKEKEFQPECQLTNHIVAKGIVPLPVGERSFPIAGRLACFQKKSEKITQDQWVLHTIKGYQIQFTQLPYQDRSPHVPQFSAIEQEGLDKEIQDMLHKGAVEEIHNPLVREGFYSNMFLVPKKDGRQRPVFNLKKLNTFVHTPHFKMEGCICCGLFSSCQS